MSPTTKGLLTFHVKGKLATKRDGSSTQASESSWRDRFCVGRNRNLSGRRTSLFLTPSENPTDIPTQKDSVVSACNAPGETPSSKSPLPLIIREMPTMLAVPAVAADSISPKVVRFYWYTAGGVHSDRSNIVSLSALKSLNENRRNQKEETTANVPQLSGKTA